MKRAGRSDLVPNGSCSTSCKFRSYRDIITHRHLATTPNVVLEASGTITLPTARAIAETSINALSVGALTHSAPALDLSMQLHP